MMMEKKEQISKAVQPLSEAELEQVNGGLPVGRPALREGQRACGNAADLAQGEILTCQLCEAKVMACNMGWHLKEVHGIKTNNP